MILGAGLGMSDGVPRPSPEFAINVVGGNPVMVSQYRGNVCVVAFILTTCPHCQKTIGILSTLQKEYGPRGFKVVASAIDDMAIMQVPDFIKQFAPPFVVGYNDRNAAMEYLQHPVMFKLYMPQLAFLDRQGVIRAQYSGDDSIFTGDQEKNLRQQIESLLKEQPAAQKKPAKAAAHKKSA